MSGASSAESWKGGQDWGVTTLTPVAWAKEPREPFPRIFYQEPPAAAGTAHAAREELGIRIEEDPRRDCPAPIRSFEDLGVLPEYALKALKAQGITAPTPVQAQALPLVLAGHDVIGLAQALPRTSGVAIWLTLPVVTTE